MRGGCRFSLVSLHTPIFSFILFHFLIHYSASLVFYQSPAFPLPENPAFELSGRPGRLT
jgi:hypothetical protein